MVEELVARDVGDGEAYGLSCKISSAESEFEWMDMPGRRCESQGSVLIS